MKKIYLSMLFAAGSIFTQAQVGVNQDDPKATLDVVAKTGNTTNDVEGLLIPRVDKAKALKMASNTALEESTMIYVNVIDASTGTAVEDVTEKGYYFYNGTKWVKVAGSENGNSGSTGVSDNIYTADGTLTSNRAVNTNGKNLVFTGTGKVGIGTDAPIEKLEIVGSAKANGGGFKSELSSGSGPFIELSNPAKTVEETANRWRIYNMTDANTSGLQYKNGLVFWSYNTTGSATPGGPRMIIDDNGNVGIGGSYARLYDPVLTERLEVGGSIKSTALAGTGTRNVVADENGKLVIGTSTGGVTLDTITGSIRKVNQANATEWGKPNTFCLIQTTTATINMPDPAKYTNKILSVNNQANTQLNYGGDYQPINNTTLDGGKGHILMSDGTGWYVIGGGY